MMRTTNMIDASFVFDDAHRYSWDHLGSWKSKWAMDFFLAVQNTLIAQRAGGYGGT